MNAAQPMADRLADDARRCLTEWRADRCWEPLQAAALAHLRRWPSMTGLPVIDRLDLDSDTEPLLEEAGRALAIKAAAYINAGDALPAMLPVAAPVEEALHALIAQVAMLRAITDRAGVRIVQHTPAAPLAYHSGCLTHDSYTAAWGEPPARYWLDHDTVTTRQYYLARLYTRVGLAADGHALDFPPDT